MKILSVNAGSSSLKFQMYEMPEEKVLISGYFERIGIGDSFYTIKINGEKIKKAKELANHEEAFKILVDELVNNNVIKSFDEIKGVGHRVVQGAEYSKSVIATDEVLKTVESVSNLAPLHNPAALVGVRAAKNIIKNATHVLVFDTAFHQTIDKEHYLYALPKEWYTKYRVRRYGAHGTSHKYISEYMATNYENISKLIIWHIGSGASISAVKDGKCIDTSMGFTPNSGLIMGTRCGDIDASIIPYIMKEANLSIDEVSEIINKESGILALTGLSDMRDVRKELEENNNEDCKTAMNMYIDRIVSYIARYYFELEGADAIVFTAGVGENGAEEREAILNKLAFLGVKYDNDLNYSIASFKDIHEGKITTNDSTIQAYVVPTDEEVVIARDTYNLI